VVHRPGGQRAVEELRNAGLRPYDYVASGRHSEYEMRATNIEKKVNASNAQTNAPKSGYGDAPR
jgi:hypothetical protein